MGRFASSIRSGGHLGPRRGGRAAFSALELLIVITVLAIVATLVVPLVDTADRSRLRAAARLLVADLQYAQIESMVHGDDRRVVVFDTRNGSYSIATRSNPAVPIVDPVDGRPYRVTFGSGRGGELAGVAITDLALDGDDVLGFGVYGELDQTTPAMLTLRSADLAVTITVDPDTGEVTVGDIR